MDRKRDEWGGQVRGGEAEDVRLGSRLLSGESRRLWGMMAEYNDFNAVDH